MIVTNDKIVFGSKYADVHSTTYLDNKDNEKEWTWVGRKKNTKAVMIIPIVENGYKWINGRYEQQNQICVIKEFRVPINDYIWEFPAGLLDVENENIDDAIRRELKEETGLDLIRIYQVTPFTFNSPGITDESIAMAFVGATGKLSKEGLESSEDIESFLMSQSEVITLLKTEKNFGAKAWLIMNQFTKTNHII